MPAEAGVPGKPVFGWLGWKPGSRQARIWLAGAEARFTAGRNERGAMDCVRRNFPRPVTAVFKPPANYFHQPVGEPRGAAKPRSP